MKVYEPKNIRNLALVGHAGSGKTTMVECFLFQSGAVTRRGTVEDRNTTSDYHDLEHEKGSSVFATPIISEFKDTKLNIIDTPGYDDYIGEMYAAIHVCDTTAIVINAANGIEVGSENGWGYAANTQKPTIFIVNKLDNDQAKFDAFIDDAKQMFNSNTAVFQYPVNPGANFNSVIDVLKMKMYTFDGSINTKVSDIPASEMDKAEDYRNQLIEAIAGSDDNLMNLFFEEGTLTDEQIMGGLKNAVLNRLIFPVFCSSSKGFVGFEPIMDFIVSACPNPTELAMPVAEGSVKVDCDPKAHTSLFTFKMFSDLRLGDLTFFKVKSGKISSGVDLINERSGGSERFGQVFAVSGKKRDEVNELLAGDIGGTLKLKNTHINDSLHDKGFSAIFEPITYPEPKVRVAIVPKTKGEEEKVGMGLHALHIEDPTVVVEHSKELRQTILRTQGDLHLGVVKWRLANRYKVETEFVEPRVPYRETIQKLANGSYRHKKQSGGAGQFAEVHMRIEPWYEGMPDPNDLNVRARETHQLDWGGRLEYLNCIVGGVIDARFLPAILKGIMEKMQFGPLTGSYVRDIRVCIYDGKMHDVDSNEAAFKTAAMNAFKETFIQAAPKILEPIYNVDVKVPEDFVGTVMSDLPTRRGLILGIDTEGRYQMIKARMPLAELDKYAQALRSMTQARATYSAVFAEYQSVPMNVQTELIETYKKSQSEEE